MGKKTTEPEPRLCPGSGKLAAGLSACPDCGLDLTFRSGPGIRPHTPPRPPSAVDEMIWLAEWARATGHYEHTVHDPVVRWGRTAPSNGDLRIHWGGGDDVVATVMVQYAPDGITELIRYERERLGRTPSASTSDGGWQVRWGAKAAEESIRLDNPTETWPTLREALSACAEWYEALVALWVAREQVNQRRSAAVRAVPRKATS